MLYNISVFLRYRLPYRVRAIGFNLQYLSETQKEEISKSPLFNLRS